MSRARHRLRVLEAAAVLALVGAALSLLPFRVVVRLAGSEGSGPGQAAGTVGAADPAALAIGRAVVAAARRLPWAPVCLPQALATGMMLRRRGIASRLCLGVRRGDAGLAAHAWLLAGGGVVCGGSEAARFVPIATLRLGLNAAHD